MIAALHGAQDSYLTDGEVREVALAAARTEAAGYLRWPRVQEVMEFAWRIGAKYLGITHCIGFDRGSAHPSPDLPGKRLPGIHPVLQRNLHT